MATRAIRPARRALVLAGFMVLTLAAPAAASSKGDDIPGGESEMRWACNEGGGTFKRDPETGTVLCVYKDGTIIICDRGAKNCDTIKPTRYWSTASTYTGGLLTVAR
jgi:hypothetical protein